MLHIPKNMLKACNYKHFQIFELRLVITKLTQV